MSTGRVYAACQVIGPKVGVGAESLRRWVLQAQVDANQLPGATSAEQQRIKELEREVRDLKEANEILKTPRFSSRGSSTGASVDLRVHRPDVPAPTTNALRRDRHLGRRSAGQVNQPRPRQNEKREPSQVSDARPSIDDVDWEEPHLVKPPGRQPVRRIDSL